MIERGVIGGGSNEVDGIPHAAKIVNIVVIGTGKGHILGKRGAATKMKPRFLAGRGGDEGGGDKIGCAAGIERERFIILYLC